MSDRQDTGIELKPAHFPGRAPVDSYGGGGFRFADMSHKGSILCLPSGIHAWHVSTVSDLTDDVFAQVLSEEGLELLLIGTGNDLVPLKPNVSQALREAGLRPEIMATGAAARTYNVLLAEGRAVGAALLAVE